MQKSLFLLKIAFTILLFMPVRALSMDDQNNQDSLWGNKNCFECRKTTSCTAGSVAGGIVCCKGFVAWDTFFLEDPSCSKTCALVWGNPRDLIDCCSSRFACLKTSTFLGSTILAGIGLIIAGCAWNPCCTQDGINKKLCCKKQTGYWPVVINEKN